MKIGSIGPGQLLEVTVVPYMCSLIARGGEGPKGGACFCSQVRTFER
ncbi:hypothetical protein AWB83_03149 [Caballeronia ptereochthonis]|uniref:Uncharacterized protein n=1 Tax=Caballeronia ptereochthonis TaxID=1777144 RepID=A0A158BDH0_9BURK|nr:hypothetical protein AWB83_03149 [Caballeronia ptereochthonis]